MRAIDLSYKTLEQIVEMVNNSTQYDAEHVAAIYALLDDGSVELRGGSFAECVRYDLEQLQLNGAKFDIYKAVALALECSTPSWRSKCLGG